jgi:hypothetical protein
MIDPNEVSTIRTGQLPLIPFNLTDKIPKEVGSDLGQNTVQNLADLIGGYLGTSSSLAFNPTTVLDGGTLPVTTSNEWLLVGKGTFNNVGGAPSITTTEELNALTSNGSFWSLSVEIPITADTLGIVQAIRSGFTTTAPSEDVLFNKFALYTPTADMPSLAPISYVTFQRLTVAQQDFAIPLGKIAKQAFVNGVIWYLNDANLATEPNTFTQSGTTVTFKTVRPIGNLIVIYIQ